MRQHPPILTQVRVWDTQTRAVRKRARSVPKTAPSVLKPLLPWWSTFGVAALDTGIPASLLRAIAVVESHGNPNAVSGTGAVGLMQLEPAAASQEGVSSRYNPVASIFGAAAYLQWLSLTVRVGVGCWRQAPGGTAACAWQIDRVISAYNAGLNGRMRWGYIRKVRGVWVLAA